MACWATFCSFSTVKKNPLETLVLNNGKTIKLADLKGKIVILDFWYRGCLPCIKAMPELVELQEEFKDDVVIIGINDRDEKADVSDFLDYKNANYFSTYKSDVHISNELQINSFPTTIIFDQNTEVVTAEVGFQKGRFKRTLRKTIKKLIKEQ